MVGASIIRVGFWGPIYYNYNREPQDSIGNYYGVLLSPFELAEDAYRWTRQSIRCSGKTSGEACVELRVSHMLSLPSPHLHF